MPRLCNLVLLTLAAISGTGLLTSRPSAADEPPLERDWFAGPWEIEYRALVLLPEEAKLKTDQGTEFTDYVLSFTAQARFVVEKDRIVTRSKTEPGPSAKWEQISEKGGRVVFEQRRPQFFHRAHWKTSDVEASDYAFTAAGVFQGNGQFSANALELNLEWTTGDGSGTSDGQRISQPVGLHTWKSNWELKPTIASKSDLPGVTTPDLILTATRTTPMPQLLAGCPPLPLLERVSIVRAATADLQVNVTAAPDPAHREQAHTLTVTVKNLGPDESLGTTLRVVLPHGTKFVSAGEHPPLTAEGEIVSFSLGKLADGAAVKFDLQTEFPAEPASDSKRATAIGLIHVSGAGYDPDQSNNGCFESDRLDARRVKRP